ncbi:DNA topoisomerase 2 [Dichanthelium oligosanthes]|uniref:DNA topoisomerase (ATP-hydrolyzing) n=1 Tax=Dichanthelium oligosanthes TaxID=888268 RepID=A0A1E5VKJ9_9POAL|nr:DNA topoisomerase 2 [Dichanthelium oligosanthes]
MDFLSVEIDVAQCRISVCYNGGGIPIEVDRESGVYMPEMIFSHLSNCDDHNGYGVKLASIFSTEFVVEIMDSRSEKKDAGEELPRIYERVNDQWEVCVSLSEGSFQHVSFLNKIATLAGETHVDHVSNQIAARVAKFFNENLPGVNVGEHEIKRHLWVFVNVFMEHPTFDSPTKGALTTPLQDSFRSRCELSGHFVEMVANCGVVCKLFPERNTCGKKARKKTGSMALEKIRK